MMTPRPSELLLLSERRELLAAEMREFGPRSHLNDQRYQRKECTIALALISEIERWISGETNRGC